MDEQETKLISSPPAELTVEGNDSSVAKVTESLNSTNDDLEDGEIEDDDDEEIPIATTEESAPIQQPDALINNQQDSPLRDSFSQLKDSEGEHRKFDGKFGPSNNRHHGKHRDRRRYDRRDDRRGSSGDDRGGKHLTEAEKSVMYLHKLERIEREKREKYKREHGVLVDDFACNIEKAIANVLKKEQKDKDGNIIKSDEDKDEKRGKKRKKKDKDKNKKSKQRRTDSPEKERSGNAKLHTSPRDGGANNRSPFNQAESRSPSKSENDETTESDASANRNFEDKGVERQQRSRNNRNYLRKNSHSRNRNRDSRRERKHIQDRNNKEKKQNQEMLLKDPSSLSCVFYMQGKCQKGEECPYSHEAPPLMKFELCKFYLMDCCAKGDKCLYMHSEFPCKYYHTGLPCYAEENCKFSHGKPLNSGLKQILFKHIETAPKEILGDFPRLTRDGAIEMINQTQKLLASKFGLELSAVDGDDGIIPSLFDINVSMPNANVTEVQNEGELKSKNKTDKPRERKSRWQDADPVENTTTLQDQKIQMALRIKEFYTEKDKDMRFSSNGDVDMRTMPLLLKAVSTMSVVPTLTEAPPSVIASSYPPSSAVIETTTKNVNSLSSTLSSEHALAFNQDVDIRTTVDVDIRNATSFFDNKDVDIRVAPPHSFNPIDMDTRKIDFAKDIDIRRLGTVDNERNDTEDCDVGDETNLEIVTEDEQKDEIPPNKADVDNRLINCDNEVDCRIASLGSNLPPNLPKKQVELFLRIQAQQKDNVPEISEMNDDDEIDTNVDWYSDDDDDCKLTIKDDGDDVKPKNEEKTEPSTFSSSFSNIPQIKPTEVMEKLGDLSKIDISAEVTKLLSSISQGALSPKDPVKTIGPPKDPRLGSQPTNVALSTATVVETPRVVLVDPRRARVSSMETKLSVYEQGSLSIENAKKDVDLRNVEKDINLSNLGDLDFRSGLLSDIDLRNLNLPFKAIQNYTPATEIDASLNSHLPIPWKVAIVDVPQPDYTGLKLTIQDAQSTGDPRLRKIFRLNENDKDSPASPKESPKSTPVRVDPRRRKMEEKSETSTQMTYSQQLNVLQSSAFYQSLTSNQKLLLNQELAAKADGSGSCDPVLTGLLSNLGLIPNFSVTTANIPNASAMNILANINNGMAIGPNPALVASNPAVLMTQGMNPAGMMPQNQNYPHPNAPGIMGAAVAPATTDFQLNFDPRQGGLLGNAPVDYSSHGSGAINYGPGNDDYYPDACDNSGNGGGSAGFRNNRNDGRGGYGRENRPRRGRHFNNRNRNNFRNNRNNRSNNRSRTPP